MIARFEVRLGDHAHLPDRRLVHHRRDFARHGFIDANSLAARRIDEADALRGAHLIDRPGSEIAEDHAGDGLAARQGRNVEIFPRRQRMRVRHAAAVAADLVLVEKGHHRAAERPEQELEPEDQADPFVDAPEEKRRQADLLHAFFLLRRWKDQMSSHAPETAIAKALQVATRSSGLLTSVRSS